MFKSRRNKQSNEFGLPLSVRAVDVNLRRTFDADLVNSMRHMITELACNGDLPHRIAFLSARRGEGVSYTSLAFATTLANDTNRRVCAVELNWWNPGVLGLLNPQSLETSKKRRAKAVPTPLPTEIATRPGVAQVLEGSAALGDALIKTEHPNLHVLPAGDMPIVQRPMTARSESLRTLFETLDQQFDHLVLDIPAVLLTSDAIALASLSDACCVVIRHGVTAASSVQRALDDVRHLPMLGVVYNQVSIKTPQWIRSMITQG